MFTFRVTLVWFGLFLVAIATAIIPSVGTEPAIGVTRKGTEIPVRFAHVRRTDGFLRVVILGGNDGEKSLVVETCNFLVELTKKAASKPPVNSRVSQRGSALAMIPQVYPDGLPEGVTAAAAVRGYPPRDGFYDHKSQPESRYLWRWVAMSGADLIIDVRTGPAGFQLVGKAKELDDFRKALRGGVPSEELSLEDDDFARQAGEVGFQGLGTVPTAVLRYPADTDWHKIYSAIFHITANANSAYPRSPVNDALQLRARTNPVRELTGVYGHELKQVAYIPALAVIGRLRTAEHFKDKKETNSLVELMEPFRSGNTNPIPKSGSDQAGHLIFAEMAKRSEGKDRERWIELCRAAADQVFDKDGKPKDLMPYHNEMSDAVFMAPPILCATGKLTGEKKYFDAAVTHFRNMKKLCLREDGLYRHSPLDEAAWGRGNGFPALGLGWALSEFPEDHPAFPELMKDFQDHIRALLKHQDEFGCWHQVIDKPGSYREFSATCMIGWALKRGIDKGWLDNEHHQPALDRAWVAAKQRIHANGVVVDICTGTGKQRSLRDYYDRPAIWGVDARGGAMALMFATEMMEKPNTK